VNQDLHVNYEPLPGYRLIEPLGAGGYGEVWRAEAPGGLIKAIKFVFGTQHEKRASIELRALDHVRSVRHPFLLSLERIEIVDGRLLVVTELADKSIKDRFDACRREGHRGIPRDELLGFLRDTADALDFMSETHALQHLDIKPENLLLLAGHVKVADFGLVKDMRQSQASLVGGMTPLYAAPEVFRGVPSRHSDQYSLAIVYQEMLTGTLPFAGSNAAELTLQHLNDEPDLAALTGPDRYAVSRALSKDPEHRYATCREFVEALAKAAVTATQFGQSQAAAEPDFAPSPKYNYESPQPSTKTEFFDDGESPEWQSPPQLVGELPATDCRIVDMPPVDLNGCNVRPVPTLVLGIGGAAGRVLAHLKQLIHDQFSGERVPAIQFLLLDTDGRAQASLTDRDAAGLTADEMLNLPLRRPQHYRENSQQLLHWLSRRWLYNIPRSLRTEGLRPLGRLALADHARQAGQRIRRAMSQAIDPQSIAESSATTSHEFRQGALRVVVVASISGGTGGGMSLDIGYAVRAILQKMGVSDARVMGIMMHSTDRDARHSELARVNAFSWLSEFNHFQAIGNSYPGDASCGLPAHQPGVSAFDDTYLLHLGENLDATEFEQATQAIAEYLRLDTLTAAGTFFEVCRKSALEKDTAAESLPSPKLRSLGLSKKTAASREFCDNFASAISRQLLSTWVGRDRVKKATPTTDVPGAPGMAASTAPSGTVDPAIAQVIHRLQIDAAGIIANARALVAVELGAEPANFLQGWLDNQGVATQNCPAQLHAVEQMITGRYEGAVDGEISLLGKRASSIIAPLTEMLCKELRRWITVRIDDPRQRLVGARRAVQRAHEHLVGTLSQVQQQQDALAARVNKLNSDAIAAASIHGSAKGVNHDRSIVTQYFALCLDRVATMAAQSAISRLLSEVKAVSDEITSLGREIDQIAGAVVRAADADQLNCRSHGESRIAAEITATLPAIVAHVDAHLQSEYLDPIGGLANTIMQGGRPRAQLTATIHELARQAVYNSLAGVNVLENSAGDTSASTGDDLKSSLSYATPTLLEYGGRRHVLAVVPKGVAAESAQPVISQRLGTPVTATEGVDSSLTLCVEADALSLLHIALDFVERRRDRVEFAGRVHCRTDIMWTPLVATNTTSASFDWGAAASGGADAQQAMSKTVVL
jgi:serine/threonine protein kinase